MTHVQCVMFPSPGLMFYWPPYVRSDDFRARPAYTGDRPNFKIRVPFDSLFGRFDLLLVPVCALV